MAKGYKTPLQGQLDKDGRHTIWVKFKDGKWYSPKDVSGLKRDEYTPAHVAELRRRGLVVGFMRLSKTRGGTKKHFTRGSTRKRSTRRGSS